MEVWSTTKLRIILAAAGTLLLIWTLLSAVFDLDTLLALTILCVALTALHVVASLPTPNGHEPVKEKPRTFKSTLVEVMIVVAVIGILAGIAVPNFPVIRNMQYRPYYFKETGLESLSIHITMQDLSPERLIVQEILTYEPSSSKFDLDSQDSNSVIDVATLIRQSPFVVPDAYPSTAKRRSLPQQRMVLYEYELPKPKTNGLAVYEFSYLPLSILNETKETVLSPTNISRLLSQNEVSITFHDFYAWSDIRVHEFVKLSESLFGDSCTTRWRPMEVPLEIDVRLLATTDRTLAGLASLPYALSSSTLTLWIWIPIFAIQNLLIYVIIGIFRIKRQSREADLDLPGLAQTRMVLLTLVNSKSELRMLIEDSGVGAWTIDWEGPLELVMSRVLVAVCKSQKATDSFRDIVRNRYADHTGVTRLLAGLKDIELALT